MVIVLSPAKSLDETPVATNRAATGPVFPQQTAALVEKLAGLGPGRIAKLMAISPKLAAVNHDRYRHWAQARLKPAMLLFAGEAYRGLGAASLDADDLRFAQRHLRLLSGLYGVLRPMDLIAPYRLEMGTKLAMGRGVKDLYAYWGDRLAEELDRTLGQSGSRVLVNLASAEYFRSVDRPALKARVITPEFKELGPAGPRMVSVYAKHQRGAMARWIIRHRLTGPDELKQYDVDGYRHDPGGSTEDKWLFVR